MTKLNILALVVTATLFVGCSKEGNDAVDKDGNCTQATVDAFNDVATKAYRLTYNPTYSDILATQNSCNAYRATIGANSCKAQNLTSGDTMTITSTSRDTICNEANRMMAAYNNQNNQNNQVQLGTCSQSQTSAYSYAFNKTLLLSDKSSGLELSIAEQACNSYRTAMGYTTCSLGAQGVTLNRYSLDSRCDEVGNIQNRLGRANNVLISKTSSIKMTVTDASAIKATDLSLYAYQEGKAFEYGVDKTLSTDKVYCVLVSTKADLRKNGSALEFSKVEVSAAPNLLKMTSDLNEEGFSEVTCYNSKAKDAKDLTIGDLKSAFRDIFAVEAVQ